MTTKTNYYKASSNYAAMKYEIRHLFEAVRRQQLDHSDFSIKELREILRDPRFTALPRAMQERLNGYKEALYETHYDNELIHGFWHNGVFSSTVSSEPDYYQKNGITPEKASLLLRIIPSGYYYRRNHKPFFVMTPPQEVLEGADSQCQDTLLRS